MTRHQLFTCTASIALLFTAISDAEARQTPTAPFTQASLADRAKAAGATDVVITTGPGGGLIIGGKLGGARFALAIPAGWVGDGLLYAHGYSTPGTPVTVSEDPVDKGPGGGLFKDAYGQGFAVGHSAYDKAGLGVETGVKNTARLRDFTVKIGGHRIYVMGDSMGGGIVVTLLETYPKAFAGGLARCGVVDSWHTLLGQITDMRLAYNALTKDTPYALPGEQDVRRTAVAPEPPAGTAEGAAQMHVFGQMVAMGTPPLTLWGAAQRNPDGPEARIARQVTAIGGFDYDAAALALPLITAALGADDMDATAGGWVYGNKDKIYSAPGMTEAEEETLNKNIQRVEASPKALAYLRSWREATGNIHVPLVTMHNRIDSLVPYAQETAFERKVEKAGRSRWLANYAVPATRMPLPVGGLEGYTHCGFDKVQTQAAWAALRNWVEKGERPAPDAVK
jgi:dienelactone hydrolase